ncbi:hypothetical protein VNI00_004772 [Paramarasmius palmivorus]|uniref:Fungal-type protein kinase domain-containing protein n=1 Tax=Paramarasmius palmivorus TaxID=297713 RepID=A0AAW0DK58_9AGAR
METSRISEVTIVERARELLDILPCLPEVLGSAVGFVDLNACHIQRGFGIEMDRKKIPHRVPCAIILVTYFPLISLTTDMELFRAAFARLICCHAILWLCGIKHGDINVASLMCSTDGTPTLWDYDCCYLAWEESPTGCTSTGITKFMASELLTNRAMAVGVQKVYRHDAEAFAWVLLWILGRYRDGKQLELGEGRLFDTWARKTNYAEVKEKRLMAFASAVKLEVQIPQPLSDYFRVDAFQFIGSLRNSQLGHEMAIVELATQGAFLDQHSKQELERKLAGFASTTFIRNVLNTRLVASSEYSGLVEDALEIYVARHL